MYGHEANKTHILRSITFFENRVVYEINSKNGWSQRDHERQCNMVHTHWTLDKQDYKYANIYVNPRAWAPTNACSRERIRAYVRTQARTNTRRKIWYFMLFYDKNDFSNAPEFYVTCTLPHLLSLTAYVPGTKNPIILPFFTIIQLYELQI
jgi:hypothetical protein